MSSEAFDGEPLTEKLTKLNNSQQSIESLSRWCIPHRKKAKQIVETWEKCFNSSQKEKRISFLYLANDILQNSRRKGSEFVNEFWKVLPGALKHVQENGDEQGKKAVARLVDIWEGRKVFGSRGQSLKDQVLAKNPSSHPVSQVKTSNPIKIVKKDAHSVRIKLAIGGLPEKIITAFESVLEEHLNEEATLNKCSTTLQHVGKIEEDVKKVLTQGNQLGSGVQNDLQEQENVLTQCIEKLENVEATRNSLVLHLKDALQEQELKLADIRSQLQIARRQIEQGRNIRTRLLTPSNNTTNRTTNPTAIVENNTLAVPTSALSQLPVSYAPFKNTEEESKKSAAAAVAARLAASASSAQMLTSVLSSLVAEEAASNNGGGGSFPMFSPEKRQKLEKPMPPSDPINSEAASAGYFSFTPPQPNQYVQSAMPFSYGPGGLPPPPPPMTMPPHFAMPRPNPPSPQQQPQMQPQPANGTFYRPAPAGMGFYGQTHPPAAPPVHRQ